MRKFHSFLVFTMCNTFVSMSGSLITPFFPPFAKEKGISESTLGYIISANPIGSFLSSVLVGKYLTEVLLFYIQKNRHIFLLLGVFGEPVSLSLLALTSTFDSKAVIITISTIGRFIGGVGTAMFTTPFFGYIPILYPDEVEKKMSISESFNGFGMFAGPILGSLFYELGGFICPFLVFSSFGIIGLPFLYFALKSVKKNVAVKTKDEDSEEVSLEQNLLIDADSKDEESQLGYLQLWTHYPIVLTFWVIILINICLTYFQPTLANYYDEQYDVGPSGVGYVMTIVTAAYSVSCYFVGKAKKQKRELVVIGLVFFGVAFTLVGPDTDLLIVIPHRLWIALLAQAILGIFCAPAYIPSMPILNEYLLYYYPTHVERAATLSSAVLTSGMALGQLTGPILSGYLTEAFGFERANSIIGIILMGTGMIYIPVRFFQNSIESVKEPLKKSKIKQEMGQSINA